MTYWYILQRPVPSPPPFRQEISVLSEEEQGFVVVFCLFFVCFCLVACPKQNDLSLSSKEWPCRKLEQTAIFFHFENEAILRNMLSFFYKFFNRKRSYNNGALIC
jgi:hypothetical protein